MVAKRRVLYFTYSTRGNSLTYMYSSTIGIVKVRGFWSEIITPKPV